MSVEYDEIGIWSEVKLAIIKEYASTYSTIMEANRRERIQSLRWIYIDAYAGPGYHLSKTSGELVEGSPLIALNTDPPFHEYHFIDTEPRRAKQLRKLAGERADVHLQRGLQQRWFARYFLGRSMETIAGRCACWTLTISI